jgi:hypothetical protein
MRRLDEAILPCHSQSESDVDMLMMMLRMMLLKMMLLLMNMMMFFIQMI